MFSNVQLFSIKPIKCFKGGLSARMIWWFLNVLEYFLLKKENYPIFRFCSIFIFNKKEPQSCQFATYRRNALFEFLTSQTGQMAFPILKFIMR